MSAPPSPEFASATARMDALCDAFEFAWQRGESPDLSDYLVQMDASQRSPFLRELLHLEVEYRRKRGERVFAEDYLRRFIDDAPVVNDVFNGVPTNDDRSTVVHVPIAQNVDDSAERPCRKSRYRIVRPHAKGGIGEVFIARDEELDREVALKEIQFRFGNDIECQTRFLSEAEITGKLEHPGIVPVYGLGRYADGRPYYAMRFIQGISLKVAIEQFHDSGRRNGSQAIEFRQLLQKLIDVSNAIEYAHSKGVLHRDLKPGNIMLGKFGEALVVDWGLARVVGDANSERLSDESLLSVNIAHETCSTSDALTQVGQVLGTPAYMSPEQASGSIDLIGPATDIYGLGAILYTLLTNRAPFTGRDQAETLELVKAGLRTECFPSRIGKDVPAPLDAICRRAMAVRAEDRYPSARSFAADLESFLADRSVAVYREPMWERVGRWARNHRSVVTGIAALVLSALVASTLGLIAVSVEQAKTKAAETALRERTEAAVRASREAEAARALEATERNRADEQRRRAEDLKEEAYRQRTIAVEKQLEAQRLKASETEERRRAERLYERARFYLQTFVNLERFGRDLRSRPLRDDFPVQITLEQGRVSGSRTTISTASFDPAQPFTLEITAAEAKQMIVFYALPRGTQLLGPDKSTKIANAVLLFPQSGMGAGANGKLKLQGLAPMISAEPAFLYVLASDSPFDGLSEMLESGAPIEWSFDTLGEAGTSREAYCHGLVPDPVLMKKFIHDATDSSTGGRITRRVTEEIFFFSTSPKAVAEKSKSE